MNAAPRPHRPSLQDSTSLEALGTRNDPIERLHAAHETAGALVRRGHEAEDPAVVARIVDVVAEIGLPTLADLWESCDARSLPGALYRLYVLREWIDQRPEVAAAEYTAGRNAVAAAPVPARVGSPTPGDVLRMADEILHGAFAGDVAAALERAAAFCVVVAEGRTAQGAADQAARMRTLSDDLAGCAELWRRSDLQ